ncbi:hypothetical protein DFP72DRAFT_1078890 [Ephemerocybe angulata]|uniref:F-box domain-containing protein n=1 Tax=Ephemerocybe angulata TaxID=980116 RepID=A0A8H6HD07_9AGAR|nr:hypothetical protein DFP72DRAFT_1078890 [Tulosesus angulatus]
MSLHHPTIIFFVMPQYKTFVKCWYRLPNELKCHVFGFLSLSDVIAFANTNLQFRVFALDCLRLRLGEMLKEYRLSLYTLFIILDRFNSVVSGSTALEIVHPTGLIPNNLDLVCPTDQADDLCSFLIFKGYTPQLDEATIGPSIIDDTPGQNCIEALRTLRHPSTGAIIHVLVATSASPLVAVFSFHSTFIMNFISAQAVYSCYPSLTEQNTGLRNVSDNRVVVQPRRLLDEAKYQQRGFAYLPPCPPLQESDRSHPVNDRCLHRPRSLVDFTTATLPFNIFLSSCSFWPKTEWRLGCHFRLPDGSVVVAECLVEVNSDGTDKWMHGNHPTGLSLAERAILIQALS